MSSTRGREAPRRVHAQWRALADATRAAGSLRLGALGVDIGRPKNLPWKGRTFASKCSRFEGTTIRGPVVENGVFLGRGPRGLDPDRCPRSDCRFFQPATSPGPPVRPLRPSGTTDPLRMRRCLPRGNSVSEGGVVGRSGVEYPGSAAPTGHDPDRRHPTRRLRGLRQGRRRRRGAIEWPDQTGGRNPASRGQNR